MKTISKMALTGALLMAMVGYVTAQNPNTTEKEEPKKTCYVDVNKDGTCDKFEAGQCPNGTGTGIQNVSQQGNRLRNGAGCGRGLGQGLRDGSGRGNGKCLNPGKGLRDGSGYNNGGQRVNFIDANKNGICDKREKR
jgi:hypothetical protein